MCALCFSRIDSFYQVKKQIFLFVFQSSRVAVYQRMWQVMNGHPDVFVYSTDYGVEKARKGGYAFLTEMTNADYFSARICDLMKVGGNVDPRGHGIATPLGSKLR